MKILFHNYKITFHCNTILKPLANIGNYFTFSSEIEPLLCMAIIEKNLWNFGLHLKLVNGRLSRHYYF